MRKYALVCLLGDIKDGHEFSSTTWPLHLTLVDDFYVALGESEVLKELKVLLVDQQPVRVRAMGDKNFGPLKNIPVTVVNITLELMSLHNKLVGCLEEFGANFVSPEFSGDGYKPHITVQGNQRVHKDDELMVQSVSVIDMKYGGNNDGRYVVGTIKLQEWTP